MFGSIARFTARIEMPNGGVCQFDSKKMEQRSFEQGIALQSALYAFLRSYPLAMAQTPEGQFVVVVDGKADALSETEGERIFDDLGQPTPMIEQRREFLERFESE